MKLYRTGKRVGLIEARTIGAQKSVGDVIIILDAHCECVGASPSSIAIFSSNNSHFAFHLGCELASTIVNTYRLESQSLGCSDRRWFGMEHFRAHKYLWFSELSRDLGMGISL